MNQTTQPSEAKQKSPSYLSRIKDELTQYSVAHIKGDPQATTEVANMLWPFIQKQLISSYYNGVRDGASGKVKPKEWKPASQQSAPQPQPKS